MASVSKTAMSRLRSTLVETHLKVQFSIVSSQLLLSEGTLVFVRHLGSKLRTCPFWMLLGLKYKSNLYFWTKLAFLCGGGGGVETMSVLTILPRAYKQSVTWGMLRLSKRSAVWKISSSGTPYFLIAAWNLKEQCYPI